MFGVAMNYADVSTYTDYHDLVINRMSLCNELLGCRYHSSLSNPLVLKYKYGKYKVLVSGSEIAEFRPYDLDGVPDAYQRLDGLYNGLWYLLRSHNLNQQIKNDIVQ